MQLFQSLPEETQGTLVQVGAKAVMDPWFGALASIPIAWQLVYLPHWIKFVSVLPWVHVNYNNVTPRYTNWDEELKSPSMSNFVKRCGSCHQNGFEAFVVFAPAVLMCRMQKANGAEVRDLCMRFLRLRVLYTILYLIGSVRIVSIFRTLSWAAGMQVLAELYKTALLA